jgi:uncharacterized membrane protein HdeD (DUF308 family)
MSTQQTFRTILGVILLLIGLWLLARLHLLGLPPKVGSTLLESVFGVFFILRGAIALRRRFMLRAPAGHTRDARDTRDTRDTRES